MFNVLVNHSIVTMQKSVDVIFFLPYAVCGKTPYYYYIEVVSSCIVCRYQKEGQCQNRQTLAFKQGLFCNNLPNNTVLLTLIGVWNFLVATFVVGG